MKQQNLTNLFFVAVALVVVVGTILMLTNTKSTGQAVIGCKTISCPIQTCPIQTCPVCTATGAAGTGTSTTGGTTGSTTAPTAGYCSGTSEPGSSQGDSKCLSTLHPELGNQAQCCAVTGTTSGCFWHPPAPAAVVTCDTLTAGSAGSGTGSCGATGACGGTGATGATGTAGTGTSGTAGTTSPCDSYPAGSCVPLSGCETNNDHTAESVSSINGAITQCTYGYTCGKVDADNANAMTWYKASQCNGHPGCTWKTTGGGTPPAGCVATSQPSAPNPNCAGSTLTADGAATYPAGCTTTIPAGTGGTGTGTGTGTTGTGTGTTGSGSGSGATACMAYKKAGVPAPCSYLTPITTDALLTWWNNNCEVRPWSSTGNSCVGKAPTSPDKDSCCNWAT